MMIGSRTASDRVMKRRSDDVTRVRDQLNVNAMMTAAMMVALNWINVPSCSEMPSWRVLAVEVIVPAAVPPGMESRTWMDCAKSARK